MPPISILVALADPTRCRIIEILREGAQPVHILAGSFKISRPAISRHLRVLKQAKLISEKKIGRENRYALHANRLKPVTEWLGDFATSAKPEAVKVEPVVEVAVAKPARQAAVKKTAPKVKSPAPTPEIVAPIETPKRPDPISQMGFDF